MSVEFKAWPKIGRFTQNRVTVTEKMDGTNSCIVIEGGVIVGVQSRKRFITPDDDNYGFASWVKENEELLLSLGDGYHYGEWVGPGIQKNPHNLNEKRLYLFNSMRWGDHNPNTPSICDVVPVLFEGELGSDTCEQIMGELKESALESGYTPEGIIIYHGATKSYQKLTFNHVKGKWCS